MTTHLNRCSQEQDRFGNALSALLPELQRRARSLSKNPTLSDDLVQEAIERALRFQHQYRVGTSLRAWVMQILFSVFITHCRKRSRERRALDRFVADPSARTEAPRVPELQQLLPSAARRLADLPESYRCVLQRVDLDEQSYQEAACELAIPLGTVMSRLHRGRKMLAVQFAA